MNSSAWKALGELAVPLARYWIRYFPFAFGKSGLWARVNWRPRAYTARTRFGMRMSGSTLDLVQAFVYYFGVWEPNLTAFVRRRLDHNPDRIFVDVGANVGYFSLLAATLLPAGKVIAVEAFPATFLKLVRNAQINGLDNIHAVSCAVAAERGTVQMFHGGCANEGATTMVAGRFGSSPIWVDARPLGDIVGQSDLARVKLIKIDVEGAEYEVLRGMCLLLGVLPCDAEVIVEIDVESLGEAKTAEIMSWFAAADFHPYELRNVYEPSYYLAGPTPEPPRRLRAPLSQHTDVVFSRIDAEFL